MFRVAFVDTALAGIAFRVMSKTSADSIRMVLRILDPSFMVFDVCDQNLA